MGMNDNPARRFLCLARSLSLGGRSDGRTWQGLAKGAGRGTGAAGV